jgi:hypothetical protein
LQKFRKKTFSINLTPREKTNFKSSQKSEKKFEVFFGEFGSQSATQTLQLRLTFLYFFYTEGLAEGRQKDATSAIFEMMKACQNVNHSLRPKTGKLQKWVQSMSFSKRSIVELILHRLQKQAVSLEEEVDLRTRELVEERKKVDDLLNEMLPRSVITIFYPNLSHKWP